MASRLATLKALIGCVAIVLLSACSEEGERVNETDLNAMFANTLRLEFSALRFKGVADLRLDKSAYLSIPGLGEDTGNWWIEGDTVCTKWKKALQRKQTCAFLKTFDDGSFAAHNPATGARLGTFQIRAP